MITQYYIFAITCILLLSAPLSYAQETVFTYRTPESDNDTRYDYDYESLQLALEKTKAQWGPFRLVPSPKMNIARAIEYLNDNRLENPMFKLSACTKLCTKNAYVPFPLDLGIASYRLFFVSKSMDRKLSTIHSLEGLRKLSIGQGHGWLDIDILNSGGFTVVPIPTYESLFSMVAEGRFDLFSRGINEVKQEYHSHKSTKNLTLNRDVGLYYPLPRFFFTNKRNGKAAKRVYEGLEIAYHDGSLIKLWKKHYSPSLNFARIESTKFFQIRNHFLAGIPDTYKQFMLPNPWGN
jgi:hypothetical protein